MEIRIDPDSTMPIYLQIIYSIKHQVATGQLQPGGQLPTVRMLATDLGINPNTVARAYDTLDTEGVITTQRGRGTYVREHPNDVHLTHIRKEQLKAMMDNVINNALSLGYPAEDIKEAFYVELVFWMRQRRSTASSKPTRSAGPATNLVPQNP